MTILEREMTISRIAVNNSQKNRRIIINNIMLALMRITVIIALIPLFWIIGYVSIQGIKVLNLDFFTKLPTVLGQTGGGILHAIQGSIVLTIIAATFAIPIGVLSAIYLVRNPNTPIGIALQFSTDVLSGIPSIVIGIFCYALVVKTQGHFSALAGSISLSIIMLPIIIRTTEEMVKLVPNDLREASLALGAPEWKTSFSVILPAAINGIVTGFMLGIARASGETAPLLFTALGNEGFDLIKIIRSSIIQHQNIFSIMNRIINSPVDSLPLTLFKYTSLPYPERISQAWGVAFILIALVLIMNITARLFILIRINKRKGQ